MDSNREGRPLQTESEREAQQRRHHDTFYQLIQNNPFGVYVIDSDFRIRLVSLGAQKVFSSIRPLIGRDFAEALRIIWPEPFATEAINRFRHTLNTGEPYVSPSTVEQRHDIGAVEAYDWRIERITLPDGQYGVVCYFYDLSERQQWEAERAALLTREQAARREAERALATQRVFLGMISHELRTPLASIKGFSSTLLATDVSFSPEEQRSFIKIIDEEADRLTDLIEQLMDVVQIQAGTFRVEPSPASLQYLVEKVMPQLQMLTAQHHLEVSVPADLPPVAADVKRIGQVLVNLVGNAAKFSPPRTTITLSAKHDESFVQVAVADAGPGIPASERASVFELFYQAAAETASRTGSGMGLTICKGLVEAHGGTIWIEERAEPGTTIAFTLPVSTATLP